MMHGLGFLLADIADLLDVIRPRYEYLVKLMNSLTSTRAFGGK